jgi:hypothetical protein
MCVISEIRDSRGITYRLELDALTDRTLCKRCSHLAGPISTNILEEIKSRCTITERQISFKINGTLFFLRYFYSNLSRASFTLN